MQVEQLAAAEQVLNLPVDLIIRSTTNPRTNFDEKALEELADSIAQVGVLEPVIVRPHPSTEGKFELVAGERRWLASQRAKKETLPSIVRELSDQQAVQSQAIENLQRENLHPLEEAKSYARLMESDPETYTIEEMSLRFGKNPQYLTNRIQLLSLIEDAQHLFLANRLPLTHAFEISRLQPADQEDALHECFRDYKNAAGILKDNYRTVEVGVRDLREWIKSNCILDLKNAPFDTKDAELLPEAGACSVCPKRAGSNPTLFGDLVRGQKCLASECFHAKIQRFVQIRIDELHGAGMKPVRISSRHRLGTREEGSGVLYMGEYVISKAGACKFTQPAIYAEGPQVGGQISVCAHKEECEVHGTRSAYTTSTPAERKKRKEQLKRQKTEKNFRWNLITAVKKKLPKTYRQEDLLMVALQLNRRMGHDNRQRVFKVYGWEMKKTPSKYGGSHVDYEGLAAKQIEKMTSAELIQFMILSALAHDLLIASYNSEQALSPGSDLIQTAKRCGIDVKEIRKSASESTVAKRVA